MPRHIDVGTVLASRYELQGLLGRGGMGLVFKALDHTLGEVVALKVLLPGIDLNPEILKRFRSEAKLARRVRHRNVCAILGYEEDGDVPFIVMELVLGTDLKRHLQKVGAMEWEDGFEVSLQVTEGLAAIHEAGVIHRDLKPANITRDEKGIVRVMDFGIAKGGTQAGLTDDGKVVCTIDYVSPEQLMSKDIDPRSDIYSFGIVIYELFTGRVPFKGDTPAATMRKHLDEPPPLHGAAGDLIPRSLVPVLERALAKDREDRFPDAQALRQALQQAREAMHRQATDSVGSDRPRNEGSPARRGVSGPYPAEAFLLVPTLARAVASPDRTVRVGAVEALARTPDESARGALTAALADPDHEVRERAAEALRRLTARPEPRKGPPQPAPTIAPQSAEAPPSAPVPPRPDRIGTSSMEEALVETSDVAVAVPESPTPPTAPSRPRLPTPLHVPPPAPKPPVPRPPPSPPRFQPPAPSPGVSGWLYWLVGGILAALIVYALLQRDAPAPIVDQMSMLPSPSPSASAAPEPSQVPPSITPPTPPPITRPIPTPTVPPPTPTPRPSAPPPPTTTTLAPPTTTMPPTPLPTPEPPPTTVPPTLPPTPPPTLPPTPPPPPAGALVEASDPGVTRPVCAACPLPQLPLIAQDPRYAAELRRSGGLVELRVLVDENGRVADVKPLKGDQALVTSAIKAVRTWRYTPAVKQGVRVSVWLVVPIQFSLP